MEGSAPSPNMTARGGGAKFHVNLDWRVTHVALIPRSCVQVHPRQQGEVEAESSAHSRNILNAND